MGNNTELMWLVNNNKMIYIYVYIYIRACVVAIPLAISRLTKAQNLCIVRPTLVVHKSNVPLLKYFETTLTKMHFAVGYWELLRFQIASGECLR